MPKEKPNEPQSNRRPPIIKARERTQGTVQIPDDATDLMLQLHSRSVKLTNLQKLFWPKLGIRKRDLLQYYINISPALLPHIRNRAMVMKRYPNGAAGEFFFMKHAPSPRPDWIESCRIVHDSGNVIEFPIINDLPTLLCVINLRLIDLHQW